MEFIRFSPAAVYQSVEPMYADNKNMYTIHLYERIEMFMYVAART